MGRCRGRSSPQLRIAGGVEAGHNSDLRFRDRVEQRVWILVEQHAPGLAIRNLVLLRVSLNRLKCEVTSVAEAFRGAPALAEMPLFGLIDFGLSFRGDDERALHLSKTCPEARTNHFPRLGSLGMALVFLKPPVELRLLFISQDEWLARSERAGRMNAVPKLLRNVE